MIVIKNLLKLTLAEYLAGIPGDDDLWERSCWIHHNGGLIPIQQINVCGDEIYVIFSTEVIQAYRVTGLAITSPATRYVYVLPQVVFPQQEKP